MERNQNDNDFPIHEHTLLFSYTTHAYANYFLNPVLLKRIPYFCDIANKAQKFAKHAGVLVGKSIKQYAIKMMHPKERIRKEVEGVK